MSLQALLDTAQQADATRARNDHPTGFEPGWRKVPGKPDQVTVFFDGTIPTEEQGLRDRIKTITGLTVPLDREVVLTQFRPWGKPGEEQYWAKFDIIDRVNHAQQVDAVAVLVALRSGRKGRAAKFRGVLTGIMSTFVVSINDLQAGKVEEAGATPELLARFEAKIILLVNRIKELRRIGRRLDSLLLIVGGDLVEGCFIYPNQSFSGIDLDRRDQVRTVVAMLLHLLDTLVGLFKDTRVLAVGGNHGENRVNGKRVNRHDNDDLLVCEMAQTAASRDPLLKNISWIIAKSEPAKTIAVYKWIIGTTHGDVFGKHVAGSTPEAKAHAWYKNMSGGRHPIGDSDVLITHHYHHACVRDWGACLWVQTPAMDSGSATFSDSSGMVTQAGMLSFVVTEDCRYQDAQVL